MATDPSIISAIAAAVEATPDNVPLRLHLATLLLGADRPAEALEQCVVVLGRQPDSREALKMAADAAFKTGDTVRAISYGRLLDALGSSLLDGPDFVPSPAPSRAPTPETAVPLSAQDDDGESETGGACQTTVNGRVSVRTKPNPKKK